MDRRRRRRLPQKVNARLHALLDEVGILVLASHNEHLLGRVCNRIVRLERGGVAADAVSAGGEARAAS